MAESEKHYSLRDTALILGVKVRTVREWLKKGQLKAIKYDGGRMWFVSQSEIDRLTNKDRG